ncbi:serine/threonine-protein kinase fray2-like [Myzus persicae]|uniref:serine/threonine-protein kinase fray2-like n=1 Tax=Myzus persicae TaxID=13164 RepID=UPI000B930A5A|nr:serine/threonine-protein kinase fray2-like [Myzus persicae]
MKTARGRSYNRKRDFDNDKREYRNNSPYPYRRNDSEERNYNKRDNIPYPSRLYNRYSRDNSKDSNYNRDRSYSRERKNNYDSSRESSIDRSYDRDFITYKHRDDKDRETRGNYKQCSKNKDGEKRYTKNRQYSRENSRERVPGKYREDRYAKESERVTSYRCNERGHYADNYPLDINYANIEPCEINLKSDKPIFQLPFRVSPSQREKLKILIDQMIDADIIEPSRSSYAAPVFLIPKKEKEEYRFLVYYRQLNNEAVADKHPIPRSQDLFRSLEGAKYYSSIDMAQGYFQIPTNKRRGPR